AGTLQEILVQEDEDIEVGQGLAVVGEGEASANTADDSSEAKEEPAEETAEEPAVEETEAETSEESSAAPAASAESEEVTLPELGESVTEGTVTRWLKEVGDTIEVVEPIVEISTDKVENDIPSPVAETLIEHKAQIDEDIEVHDVLSIVV